MKTETVSEKTINMVLDKRGVNFPPDHFSYVTLRGPSYPSVNWIEKNLKKRFYVGERVHLDDDNNKLIVNTVIGFEDKKEMTLFLLSSGCV